ncbi:MAG: RIO1 family regulatory kinase/ATPase [archaeon]|nr:serine protein kinase RIO [Nanoarchaeota archaeon]
MTTFTYQERFRTIKGVFDEFTQRNLFELQSRGKFDELISPIFVGKESNVFLASKDDAKVIVKIYRVQNCDFNHMFDYIKQDPRYEFLKKNRRQIIFAWTQREYKNLLRAEKANVTSPKVLAWKNNVIVEELVGNEEPAPPLKDAHPEDPKKFFKLLLIELKKLYQGGLVHGDLSAFNILNFNEKPYLIDFSQGTITKNYQAEELLKRDLMNVLHFFKKFGIKADLEQTFKKVTAGK